MLLKEHRYIVQLGSELHILHIHELLLGTAVWGGRFRLQIPADSVSEAETIYGNGVDELAEKGYLALVRRRET